MLARGTALNVFVYKLCKTWPPKFRGDELVNFEITQVTDGLVVVATGKNGAMEGILQGDCYAWSWVRGKRSLCVKGSRYEEGLLFVGSRGFYARDFLGKGQGFEDTS